MMNEKDRMNELNMDECAKVNGGDWRAEAADKTGSFGTCDPPKTGFFGSCDPPCMTEHRAYVF